MKLSYVSCLKKSRVLRKISLFHEGVCWDIQFWTQGIFMKTGASERKVYLELSSILIGEVRSSGFFHFTLYVLFHLITFGFVTSMCMHEGAESTSDLVNVQAYYCNLF
ncbi:hypothetical protein MKW92_004035 [Papaver armeniacum]|nr:hypothetical protein MKW92_004035 [Papaver armeniacum]